MAARAIVGMAFAPRRQKLLGTFTSFMVWANRLAPGILDHYLARTGIASQQADMEADPERPVTLWKPVDDLSGTDHGARGVFGELEGGMLNGRMLRGFPAQVRDVARSTADRAAELAGYWRQRARKDRCSPTPVG